MNLSLRQIVLPVTSLLLFSLGGCHLADRPWQDYLRPVRRLIFRNRTYWTDKISYRGAAGTELVYYKKGRPAQERFYNNQGLLVSVNYFNRYGTVLRRDSLVYAGEELIAGYFFAEPDHNLVQRFLNYKKQGQLSQRSWFDGEGGLLSREFFLFDRRGNRRMRMIFDGQNALLYSETFNPRTDQLEIQNTYSKGGPLTRQIRYENGFPCYRYQFNPQGEVIAVAKLQADGSDAWLSDLFYNADGSLARSNFSVRGRYLFSYLGDLEFTRQDLRSWKDPFLPGVTQQVFKISHQDPFVTRRITGQNGYVLEYRLPHSGALFQSSRLDSSGKALADTLYAAGSGRQPVSVVRYDTSGLVWTETSYTNSGEPAWRHVRFHDANRQVIREELFAMPDSFVAAVTRIYDVFGEPALSEKFSAADSFDGSWVYYPGGGIKHTRYYNNQEELTESWLQLAAGDTIRHSRFQTLDYFRVESILGPGDTLQAQRRFTRDGMLNWTLEFDSSGQVIHEIYRKKGGTIYREVHYEPATRLIKSILYAPGEANDVVEISSEVVTRLDGKGKIIQIVSRNSSGERVWEKRYAYRKGRLLKSAQLGPDGKPVLISGYTHNDLGQVLQEIALSPQGDTVHTVSYRYNTQHQEIWKSFESRFTATTSSNRYYYTDDGLLRRNEIIEANRFIEAVEYAYYPRYFLRIANHYNAGGELIRKEIESYFGENVFEPESYSGTRGTN